MKTKTIKIMGVQVCLFGVLISLIYEIRKDLSLSLATRIDILWGSVLKIVKAVFSVGAFNLLK